MKFDACLMNPPYKGLHLKFVPESINFLSDNGYMSCIFPASLTMCTYNKRYNNIREVLNPYVTYCNIKPLNKKFNTGLYVPYCILALSKNKNTDEIIFDNIGITKVVNHFNDCNLVGKYSTIISIENKIKNKSKVLIDYDFDNSKTYSPNTAFIRYSYILSGHSYQATRTLVDEVNNIRLSERYFMCGCHKYDNIPVKRENIGTTKSKNKNIWSCIYCDKFDTFEENSNFLLNLKDFIKHSKLAHYLGITYNIEAHNLAVNYVPYLDFTHKWNDEMLYKFFDFNEEEISLIENTCKRFEWNTEWNKKFYEYD